MCSCSFASGTVMNELCAVRSFESTRTGSSTTGTATTAAASEVHGCGTRRSAIEPQAEREEERRRCGDELPLGEMAYEPRGEERHLHRQQHRVRERDGEERTRALVVLAPP